MGEKVWERNGWCAGMLVYWSESLSACSGISCLRRRMTMGRRQSCHASFMRITGQRYHILNAPNLLNPVNTHAKGVS